MLLLLQLLLLVLVLVLVLVLLQAPLAWLLVILPVYELSLHYPSRRGASSSPWLQMWQPMLRRQLAVGRATLQQGQRCPPLCLHACHWLMP